MPRAFIKGLLSADLTSLFVPQEPKVLDPQAVDESLWLTYELLTGTHKFRSYTAVDVAATLGVAEILTAVTPADNYDYVFLCAATHNDTVAHILQVIMQDTITAKRYSIMTAVSIGPFAVGAPDMGVSPNRAFLVPPNWKLGAQADAMSGTATLRLRYAFVRHSMLDPHPKI